MSTENQLTPPVTPKSLSAPTQSDEEAIEKEAQFIIDLPRYVDRWNGYERVPSTAVTAAKRILTIVHKVRAQEKETAVATTEEKELGETEAVADDVSSVLQKALQHYARRYDEKGKCWNWLNYVCDSYSGEVSHFDWHGDEQDEPWEIAEAALKFLLSSHVGCSPAPGALSQSSPVAPTRQERCIRCNQLTDDWVDTEQTHGRCCRPCEAIISREADAVAPTSECEINGASSRMCERGTKSCEIRHSVAPTPSEVAQEWTVSKLPATWHLMCGLKRLMSVGNNIYERRELEAVADAHNATLTSSKTEEPSEEKEP